MATLRHQQEKLGLDTFLRARGKEPCVRDAAGMCPVLAVTNSTMNAIAMGLATTFVLVASSGLISLLRNLIPKQVRIASHIVIIATLSLWSTTQSRRSASTCTTRWGLHPADRGELRDPRPRRGYASNSDCIPRWSTARMGAGFTVALLALGTVREVLGNGTLLGFQVAPANFGALG